MFGAVPSSTHFRPRAPSSARGPSFSELHTWTFGKVVQSMEAHVPSLDQLRNNAAECIRLAEGARTSAHKSFFIEMADRWLTLAERAEKTHDR